MNIQAENLQFGWNPSAKDIFIPKLSIHAGEQVFLHGASGSGKSTLLNLLSGLLLPQQGCVKLGGKELSALSSAQRDKFRAEHIGFIFQGLNLLPYLSVKDNLLLACRFSPQRKRTAIAQHGSLDKAAKNLLKSLNLEDELWSREAAKLSVGQRQRVAIARAMIGSPPIIIADEPTSALDDENQGEFMRLLLEQVKEQQTTLLFVSHDLALSSYFNRSLCMQELNHVA